MTRSVVIHGHYYQPPREDPWLDEIERQPTAAPFHDWNARIERESYGAVVAARILDSDGRIRRLINALAWTSFNFGPTLLVWLEREAPATYEAILDADRTSAARLGGHGNAIAQAYHHTILPLASRRDKVTEVRWGIADFRHRFGREPLGMWLPETAVDDETLDVLASEGIRFTILAPHQVVAMPPHGMPGLYRTEHGREIALFVYDGPMSHGIAFGGLLADSRAWTERLTAGLVEGAPPELLAVATDGETYGHHHKFGEMALAAVIEAVEREPLMRLENFASFLARHPAVVPVELVSPTSWSCAHGVERWRADCGCGSTKTSPSQAWRAPLRQAMTELADELHEIFAGEGAAHFAADPWAVRDAYGAPDFAARTASLEPRARELLELERNALRLSTSCGWFFDDIDRLEPLQIMRYAARAIDLAGPAGAALEKRLLDTLTLARGNDPASGTGRDIYLRKAKPRASRFAAVAAAHALARAAGAEPTPSRCCRIASEGNLVTVRECATGREHVFDVRVVDQSSESDGALRRLKQSVAEVRAVASDDVLSFTLADVPDAEREAIVAAVRHAIVARALDSAERARLASGEPLADAMPAALLRAVSALANDRGTAAIARVLDLADLTEAEDVAIARDVQTAFARVRDDLAGAPMILAAVARRLGFAVGDRAAPRSLAPA